MFYAALQFCKSEFPYTSMLLFHIFDTINDNCYCSQALYTERVKSHSAADHEAYRIVLKVGISQKPNFHVAYVTSITKSQSLQTAHPRPLMLFISTDTLTVTLNRTSERHIGTVFSDCILPTHYPNTHDISRLYPSVQDRNVSSAIVAPLHNF